MKKRLALTLFAAMITLLGWAEAYQKYPKVLWVDDTKTLFFVNDIFSWEKNIGNPKFQYPTGSGHLVTSVWVNEDVTNSGNSPAWASYASSAKKIVIEADFADVVPNSITGWFNSFLNLESIEGLQYLNTSAITTMSYLFHNCSKLTNIDVSHFNTQNVTDMNAMFSRCSGVTSLDLSSFNTSKVSNMKNMFSDCSSLAKLDIRNFETGNVTNMAGMFSGCTAMTTLTYDVEKFDTQNVTDMDGLFWECKNLSVIDVSQFNTAKVTNMRNMFNQCSKLQEIDVSSFNTENVTSMSGMFFTCSALISLDLSNFNTKKVTTMSQMFDTCSELSYLNLCSFDTQNVTNMQYMFRRCPLTNFDISNFHTGKVTTMEGMFYGCDKLNSLDLSNFDTSSLEYLNAINMFIDVPTTCFVYLPSNLSQDVQAYHKTNLILKTGDTYSCSNFTLNGVTDATIMHDFTAPQGVTYPRTLPGGSNAYTIYLPYDLEIPAGAKVFKMKGVQTEGDGVLAFQEISGTTMTAYTPYLLTTTEDISTLGTTTSTIVKKTENEATQTAGGYTFVGTVTELNNAEATEIGAYIMQAGGVWAKVTNEDTSAYIPAMRGYLTNNDGAAAIRTMLSDESSGIQAIKTIDRDGNATIYDLSGRKLYGLQQGINIVGGKKILRH